MVLEERWQVLQAEPFHLTIAALWAEPVRKIVLAIAGPEVTHCQQKMGLAGPMMMVGRQKPDQ